MQPKESSYPRVLLLTRDGVYSRIFLKSFCEELGLNVVGVLHSAAIVRRGAPFFLDLWKFVSKVGLFYALYQAAVAWVLPRVYGLTSLPMDAFVTKDVNDAKSVAWIRERSPDFLLCFNFNQIVSDDILKIPQKAALNFHPSFLPEWRGVDPVFFALQKQGSVHGYSIHLISQKIDMGDVLKQNVISGYQGSGLVQINRILFEFGGRMAADVINNFDDFYSKRLQQAGSEIGSYFGWSEVGNSGLVGLCKALWPRIRKV